MLNYDSLLADASHLPITERIQLAEALWDKVPEGALPPLSDEWLTEITRRSTEFENGSIATVSWEEIRTEALQRLSRQAD